MTQFYIFLFLTFFFSSSSCTTISGLAIEQTSKTSVNLTVNCQNSSQPKNGSLPKVHQALARCSFVCIQDLSYPFFLFFLQFIKFYILVVPGILFVTALYISRKFTRPTPRSYLYSSTTSASTTVECSISPHWKFNKFMLQTSSCACFLFSNAVFLGKEVTSDLILELTRVKNWKKT